MISQDQYRFLKSKAWMKHRYIDDELSTQEIGDIIGVQHGRVSYWLKRLGIGTRGKFGCSREKTRARFRGDKNPSWKGGKIIINPEKPGGGYIAVLSPDHPYRNGIGYVLEHRLVMEAHIGRILLPTEVVHHINGITTDNRIENLMLFSDHGSHISSHNLKRWEKYRKEKKLD